MPTSSLTKFAVKPAKSQPEKPISEAVPVGNLGARARGKNRRVGIAVRLGHEDWYRLHDLAVREHTSLQALIVAGLSRLMEDRGLPPLSGN